MSYVTPRVNSQPFQIPKPFSFFLFSVLFHLLFVPLDRYLLNSSFKAMQGLDEEEHGGALGRKLAALKLQKKQAALDGQLLINR